MAVLKKVNFFNTAQTWKSTEKKHDLSEYTHMPAVREFKVSLF